MKIDSISMFFPAYNEGENIVQTINQAVRVAQGIAPKYEIIVVDDGSTDDTGSLAEKAARENPFIRVIHHNPNRGYGAAVLSGIAAAQHDYVFFSDADLQFDLDEISKLVEHVPQYDVVLGYRARRQDHMMRLANAKAWNVLNRALFKLKVKDIDCAFKLFKTSLVKDLPIRSQGAMLSAELLILLQNQGVKFKEVPVTHLPRRAGSPTGAKPTVILKAFKEMMHVYRKRDQGTGVRE